MMESATLMKCVILLTVDLSVVGFSEELPYPVDGNGEGDPCSHLQCIYAYHIPVLLNTVSGRTSISKAFHCYYSFASAIQREAMALSYVPIPITYRLLSVLSPPISTTIKIHQS